MHGSVSNNSRSLEPVVASLALLIFWNLVVVPRLLARHKSRLTAEELEERIAPSNANFPPGQFPAGNPAQAPGNSNPNEHPGDHGP